jgi:hypothetical protein
VAYLVHFLSGSYCSISRDHMMPLISRLGILISYDSVTEKATIAKEKKDLEVKGLEMQKTIADIVKANNKKFHQAVNQRAQLIDATFKKMVPEIPTDKKEELKILVKNAVEKGVSNADMDDVNLEEF